MGMPEQLRGLETPSGAIWVLGMGMGCMFALQLYTLRRLIRGERALVTVSSGSTHYDRATQALTVEQKASVSDTAEDLYTISNPPRPLNRPIRPPQEPRAGRVTNAPIQGEAAEGGFDQHAHSVRLQAQFEASKMRLHKLIKQKDVDVKHLKDLAAKDAEIAKLQKDQIDVLNDQLAAQARMKSLEGNLAARQKAILDNRNADDATEVLPKQGSVGQRSAQTMVTAIEDQDHPSLCESFNESTNGYDQNPSASPYCNAGQRGSNVDLAASPLARRPMARLIVGYNFDKKQLRKVRTLQAGASGPVTIYWHLNTNRLVARKHNKFGPEHRSPDGTMPMEAYLLAKVLKHPHIIKLLQARIYPPLKSPWPTIEYYFDMCNGGSLSDLIKPLKRSKYLDEYVIWLILSHIGQALLYMHGWIVDFSAKDGRFLGRADRKPIYHRDVKPANIFVERPTTSQPLALSFILGDFGLSDYEGGYLDQVPCGTRYFEAPEIKRVWDLRATTADRPPHNTAATDVYSLGATLYYAMTKKSVHEEGGPKVRSHPGGRMFTYLGENGSEWDYSIQLLDVLNFLCHPERTSRPQFRKLLGTIDLARSRLRDLEPSYLAYIRSQEARGLEWPFTVMHDVRQPTAVLDADDLNGPTKKPPAAQNVMQGGVRIANGLRMNPPGQQPNNDAGFQAPPNPWDDVFGAPAKKLPRQAV